MKNINYYLNKSNSCSYVDYKQIYRQKLLGTLLFLSISLFTSCNAQIVNIEKRGSFKGKLTKNIYFKDTNYFFNKFKGSWAGENEKYSYIFQITTKTTRNIIYEFREDLLSIRYKISDKRGIVMANTLELPDDSPYIIRGNLINKDRTHSALNYVGFESDCGQLGTVYVCVNENIDLLSLMMYPTSDLIDSDCKIEQILPTDFISLKRFK